MNKVVKGHIREQMKSFNSTNRGTELTRLSAWIIIIIKEFLLVLEYRGETGCY